jgi:hypothetical protein
MFKSIYSPLNRIATLGLIAIMTSISPMTTSPSLSAKAPVGKVPSITINSPEKTILSGSHRKSFMDKSLKIILNDLKHPLSCLVDYEKGTWKRRTSLRKKDRETGNNKTTIDDVAVQAGHLETQSTLPLIQTAQDKQTNIKLEHLALQEAQENHDQGRYESKGHIFTRSAIDIGGVPVTLSLAHMLAKDKECPSLNQDILQSAKPHPGYSAFTRPDPPRKSKSSKQSSSKKGGLGPKGKEALDAAEEISNANPGIFNANQGTSEGGINNLLSVSNNPEPKNSAVTSAPGGIDFSTLELRYIAEDSGLLSDRGLKYAFNGTPAASNKNLNAGRIAAAQASDAFFVWLSLSPDKFWVNLNPNEPDRIIDPQFAKTDAGRILLQSDFQMKKTVAKLIHPDTSLGKQYWDPLMKQVREQQQRNGARPCSPVFRMWIVPSPATVRKDNNGIYIADAPLNVKLESTNSTYNPQEFSSLLGSCTAPDQSSKTFHESLYRKLILPRIVQAVNTAPEYAELRRVYRSRVAAEWYRQHSASNATTYREMVNNGDVSSWPARQNWSSRQVFDQYVNSFKKGEFHVVHSHQWQEGNMIYTQKQFYIYGGVDFSKVFFKQLNSMDFQKTQGDLRQVVDNSMKSPVADQHGKIWLGGNTITSRAIWKSIWFYLAIGFLALPFLIRWQRLHRKRAL